MQIPKARQTESTEIQMTGGSHERVLPSENVHIVGKGNTQQLELTALRDSKLSVSIDDRTSLASDGNRQK